jgi:TolA-binding protein
MARIPLAAGIKKSDENAEASVESAGQQDKKTAWQNSDQITALQSTLDDLKTQISELETAQKTSNQKLNARITALSNRMGG